MSILAIIPARSGSKGIPHKNKRLICGRPLIYWTISAALTASGVDEIIVSTDDEDIADIASGLGVTVPFMRPSDIAKDDTPALDPVLHTLSMVKRFESAVLLQPTSPLRTSRDIEVIIEMGLSGSVQSVASVCEVKKPIQWQYSVEENGTLKALSDGVDMHRRQDANVAYTLNGALYFFKTSWILRNRRFVDDSTVAYIMPEERSVDIDSEFDWQIAEFLLSRREEWTA